MSEIITMKDLAEVLNKLTIGELQAVREYAFDLLLALQKKEMDKLKGI
jgi:hypothetical protein